MSNNVSALRADGIIDGDPSRRLTLSLVGDSAALVRELSSRWSVSPAEVTRRALTLVSTYADLADNEDLVIRNGKDGTIIGLRFEWAIRRNAKHRSVQVIARRRRDSSTPRSSAAHLTETV